MLYLVTHLWYVSLCESYIFITKVFGFYYLMIKNVTIAFIKLKKNKLDHIFSSSIRPHYFQYFYNVKIKILKSTNLKYLFQ